jgi:hypothetical protein
MAMDLIIAFITKMLSVLINLLTILDNLAITLADNLITAFINSILSLLINLVRILDNLTLTLDNCVTKLDNLIVTDIVNFSYFLMPKLDASVEWNTSHIYCTHIAVLPPGKKYCGSRLYYSNATVPSTVAAHAFCN